MEIDNPEEFWARESYGFYLNAVDDLLEKRIGRTSTQDELAYIAECQESYCLPSECADSIIARDVVKYLKRFD